MTQEDLFTQATATPEAVTPIQEETTQEPTPITLDQLTLNQWHFCVKINGKVTDGMCHARQDRGRCIVIEKSKGKGDKKVTVRECEPTKKSRSDPILEIAINGRVPEQTTEEGEK